MRLACGWPPAGKGKGWGQKGQSSDDPWQDGQISPPPLRPVAIYSTLNLMAQRRAGSE